MGIAATQDSDAKWIADDDQRVRQTHVNLVDLVDTPRMGASVNVFPNLKKL
jgi:hypothetical protein